MAGRVLVRSGWEETCLSVEVLGWLGGITKREHARSRSRIRHNLGIVYIVWGRAVDILCVYRDDERIKRTVDVFQFCERVAAFFKYSFFWSRLTSGSARPRALGSSTETPSWRKIAPRKTYCTAIGFIPEGITPAMCNGARAIVSILTELLS